MRSHGFGVDHGAAQKKRRRAGKHEKNVDLRFMPFDLTLGLSVHEQKTFVGKISKLLYGKMMGILCCRIMHFRVELLEAATCPLFESRRRGFLRAGGCQKHKNHCTPAPEFVHRTFTREFSQTVEN